MREISFADASSPSRMAMLRETSCRDGHVSDDAVPSGAVGSCRVCGRRDGCYAWWRKEGAGGILKTLLDVDSQRRVCQRRFRTVVLMGVTGGCVGQ